MIIKEIAKIRDGGILLPNGWAGAMRCMRCDVLGIIQSFTSQRNTPVNATKHISELKFEVITLVFFLLDSTILYICWPEIFKLWGFSIPWLMGISIKLLKK